MRGKRPNRRSRRRSGRKNAGRRRADYRAIDHGWDSVATLVDERPRKASMGNILVLFVMGVVMGLILYWITIAYTRQFDKAWVYAINTVIALAVKLVFQWLMVLAATPWAVFTMARRIILRRHWNQLPQKEGSVLETTLPNNMTVTAVATMILATELSRENVQPIWFIDSSYAVPPMLYG